MERLGYVPRAAHSHVPCYVSRQSAVGPLTRKKERRRVWGCIDGIDHQNCVCHLYVSLALTYVQYFEEHASWAYQS